MDIKNLSKGLAYIVLFIGVCAFISAAWVQYNFGNIEWEQILLNLAQPMDGVAIGLVVSGCVLIFVVGSLLSAILIFFVNQFFSAKWKAHFAFVFGLLLISYPICKWHLINFFRAQLTTSLIYEQEHVAPDIQTNGRNLIMIILESYEKSFQNKDVMGQNLSPFLTQIQNENTSFKHFRQLKQSSWTITSLMSSFCGVPLKLANTFVNLETYRKFVPDLPCWPEQLAAQGYEAILMKAAAIQFTGTDNFARQHGFHKAVGSRELMDKYSDGENSSWGLNDTTFYKAVKDELKRLSSQNKPFLLATVQADTHQPGGHLSKDCPVIYNDYRDAVLCSDRKAIEMIKWIQAQPFYKNTTIVVMGDHLVTSTDIDSVLARLPEREIFFTIINPQIEKKPQEHLFTNLDIGPTILDAMGFEFNGRFGLGRSLYRSEKTLIETRMQEDLEFDLACRSEKYRSWGNIVPPDVFNNPENLETIAFNEVVSFLKDIHIKYAVNGIREVVLGQIWTNENWGEIKLRPAETDKPFDLVFKLVVPSRPNVQKNIQIFAGNKKIAKWMFSSTHQPETHLKISPDLLENGVLHLRLEMTSDDSSRFVYDGIRLIEMLLKPLENKIALEN